MTNPWIEVLSVSKVSSGSYCPVFVASESILIVNQSGRYFAVENVCTHDGNALEGGELEGEEIICPRHGAGFCLKTGKATRSPAYEDIKSFPLRIVEDKIQIQLKTATH